MMYDRIVTSVLGPVSFLMKFPFNQKKKRKKKDFQMSASMD